MKIIAFGATTSTTSINKALAAYTANLVDGAEVEVLDLNDYQAPLFSEDLEKEVGQSEAASRLLNKIEQADAVVVSFAEHNGNFTAAYKNLFDWASRIDRNVYKNKPVLFLATSPGPGGASSVLNIAVNSAPYFAADLKGSLSVPSFYDVFDLETKTVTDAIIQDKLASAAAQLIV